LVPPHRSQTTRFCSRYCVKRCLRCNNPVTKRPGRRRFCSHACAAAYLSGPRSGTWKGGKTRDKRSGKTAAKLRQWRRLVFKRDGFECLKCGSTDRLHAHHIKSFAKFPKLRFDVSNGQTLCIICHGKVHGKSFAKRRGRKCVDCGKRCSGKNRQGKPRCRSCGLKLWHALGRPSHTARTERMRQQHFPF